MPTYRSHTTTKGRNMAGARSLWRATGMKDDDFDKPIIAVANSFTQFVPGHVHLKDMGQLVIGEIEKAGGVGKEFNTIAVDDGIAMGHDGMLYSLPSRDIIADSVEYMVNAHCVLAYLKGNEIVKLVDSAEEDHGPGKNTFYFINGKLFFLFSQIMTVEMTENPNTHVRELRLYFDEETIIDALVKTKIFKSGETIDMSNVANEQNTTLVKSKEEAEYYTGLAEETLEFFKNKETFDEFYGGE